jgi:hypothetical protein
MNRDILKNMTGYQNGIAHTAVIEKADGHIKNYWKVSQNPDSDSDNLNL